MLSNAIKYTLHGYVNLKAMEYEEHKYFISVEDTGVGIDMSEFGSLFNAFKKIKDFRHLNKTGCGLGLTLSKNLAKALGGDITVSS